ncbi:hypothetical protein D4Q76_02660 [archaeon]|nr:MAG: hypothetical protein D4Q76_02660 [archaeon]
MRKPGTRFSFKRKPRAHENEVFGMPKMRSIFVHKRSNIDKYIRQLVSARTREWAFLFLEKENPRQKKKSSLTNSNCEIGKEKSFGLCSSRGRGYPKGRTKILRDFRRSQKRESVFVPNLRFPLDLTLCANQILRSMLDLKSLRAYFFK